MAEQRVDSEKIAAAADALQSANERIGTEFEAMKKKAKALERDWNSRAGTRAKTTMYELFKTSEVRASVLQNYVAMLKQQVNPGYLDTERVNTQLADKFK